MCLAIKGSQAARLPATHCYPVFGAGLDYICVQSYDGLLSIFECESFAFARFLPNFLIPGTAPPVCAIHTHTHVHTTCVAHYTFLTAHRQDRWRTASNRTASSLATPRSSWRATSTRCWQRHPPRSQQVVIIDLGIDHAAMFASVPSMPRPGPADRAL